MNPEICYSSSVLFQMLSSDLNASLATADELSREFDSLMKECSSKPESKPESEPVISSSVSGGTQWACPRASSPAPSQRDKDAGSPRPPSDAPMALAAEPSPHSENLPMPLSPPVFSPPGQPTPPLSGKDRLSPSSSQQSLTWLSPQARRRVFQYESVSSAYLERSPSPRPLTVDQSFHLKPQPSPNPMAPYPSSPGRSPRPERRTPPHLLGLSPAVSGSLPRSFGSQNPAASPPGSEAGARRQRIPAAWTENDADAAYGRKHQRPYEKTERLRLYGSLDSSSRGFSKDSRTLQFQPKASLPRNARLNASRSERASSSSSSPYGSPTAPRKSYAPLAPPRSRWHRPVPLSVIMRAQTPLRALVTRHPRAMLLEGDGAPRALQQHLLQLARQGSEEGEPGGAAAPPQSPTGLPALGPEAQACPELLLLRSEIPRALKKRGGLSQAVPLVHRRQYQQMIHKLFSRRDAHHQGEPGSESSSSSEGEESPRTPAAAPLSPVLATSQHKGLQPILKRPSRERKSSGSRARISPLVLLLDGALVGELDTVQRAAKEMSDPSQPNDEGITALHNAICGGHYSIVDFLVQIGANVSAPDSHGWTPLHCAAACNDRSLCEYLVRSGAAVLSVTEGDGATAVEKCDPYAPGFEGCTAFLRGVEEAMGAENGGVLYALWGYPAQAPDELSFREGDAVAIRKKQEGSEWWWASLGNREGFVPSNYFALFPKVRPRSLLDHNQKGR
ncbi:relA-associated inhibitor-like [Anguilla rostrata]|uniref:relA-associated inhibitor-like n=1 Tax=Anguilla rostrata TaxID=7938 RepID=UPI0030CF2A4E